MFRTPVLIFVMLFFFNSGTALGDFIDNGGYLIDNVSGNAWYTNMDDFWNMDYGEQVAAVNNLNTGSGTFGITTWRLAYASEVVQMFSHWENLEFPLEYFSWTSSHFSGPWENFFWDARTLDHLSVLIKYIADDTTGQYHFQDPILSSLHDNIKTYEVSAWIIASDVTPVPEPSAKISFAVGILILFGISRKRKELFS
ncbi:MAG: hypothetical protein HUN04_14080 [Desulfobacter sp.]|nr:MAG: hypothetical protein HUN04_14080 [Desulfobacter sp.]